MNIFALSGLINAIVALGFGLFVISKKWNTRGNQLFFQITLAVALWSFGYWRWLTATDADSALLWVRILTTGSVFIPVSFFHWTLDFTGVRRRSLLAFSYLAALFLAATSFSRLMIDGMRPKLTFLFWPDAGPLYVYYVLFLFGGLILYSCLLLFRGYRVASPEKRGQFFYILLGAILGFGGGLTNFFLWYDIPIPPYGNFLVGLFPIFLGYAVLRHNLFNVKVLAAELLTFTIWVAVIMRVLFAQTQAARIQELAFLALVLFLGLFLIRSVLRLDAANERLKELDKQKTAFLSFASHQVKAPITTIRGYASMIADGSYGETSEKAKEAAGKIMEVGLQVATMVNDFLDLRKIEEGKMEFKMAPFDLVALVQSVVDNLQVLAKAKSLTLTLERSPATPSSFTFMGDSTKLRQVFQNLIENAIKYTDKGFVKVSLQGRGGAGVSVSVQDSGRGIPPEVLPHLFEQFYRGSAGSIQGSGLGLFIAREIVKAHGGDIVAESEGEGKGARFGVTFE